jgi:hypothetical protein
MSAFARPTEDLTPARLPVLARLPRPRLAPAIVAGAGWVLGVASVVALRVLS